MTVSSMERNTNILETPTMAEELNIVLNTRDPNTNREAALEIAREGESNIAKSTMIMNEIRKCIVALRVGANMTVTMMTGSITALVRLGSRIMFAIGSILLTTKLVII